MRNSLIALVLAVAPLACASPPSTETIVRELELTSADLVDLADFVEDEQLSADLMRLADLFDLASAAMGSSDGSAGGYFEAALVLADALADRLEGDAQERARLVVFAARSALRRWQAYAAPEG